MTALRWENVKPWLIASLITAYVVYAFATWNDDAEPDCWTTIDQEGISHPQCDYDPPGYQR